MRLFKWFKWQRRATVTDVVHVLEAQIRFQQGMVEILNALHMRIERLEELDRITPKSEQ